LQSELSERRGHLYGVNNPIERLRTALVVDEYQLRDDRHLFDVLHVWTFIFSLDQAAQLYGRLLRNLVKATRKTEKLGTLPET
jgi:hypothetical protein